MLKCQVSFCEIMNYAGITCEICAVNKMAAAKIALLFLPFSSKTVLMHERMDMTMFQCLRNFSTMAFDGNIPHAVVRMKKDLKKGGILNRRLEFNFWA